MVQYGAVWCSMVQYGAVKCILEEVYLRRLAHCSFFNPAMVLQNPATFEPAEKCSMVQYGAVRCSEVQYSAVKCSKVQYGAVKCILEEVYLRRLAHC